MRVLAKIGPYEMVVLIDSRYTYNFISEKMANMLQLPIVPTKSFNVRVANRGPLKCQGRFENVHIAL
jgi:tRNA(Ser,Leu) C12 N-acetylase TAN1